MKSIKEFKNVIDAYEYMRYLEGIEAENERILELIDEMLEEIRFPADLVFAKELKARISG